VSNVKIGDMATLNQLLQSSSPDGNITVPERGDSPITTTPAKSSVSESDIDEMLK
jgi:hypothetical protein